MQLLNKILKFFGFRPKCKTCKFWEQLKTSRAKSRFGKCRYHSTTITPEYMDKRGSCREHKKEEQE